MRRTGTVSLIPTGRIRVAQYDCWRVCPVLCLRRLAWSRSVSLPPPLLSTVLFIASHSVLATPGMGRQGQQSLRAQKRITSA